MRKAATVLAGLAVAAAIVIGLIQAGGSTTTAAERVAPLTRSEVARPIAGSPARLAALHSRVNERVAGGRKALDAQLRALRGYPVVVNMWASWCGPCEAELPFFQRQARTRGARVAFLGVNVNDARSSAEELAKRYPMAYPSFEDPDEEIADSYKARGLPVTVFYDARGERQMVHQGVFASEQLLSDAIQRYAVAP